MWSGQEDQFAQEVVEHPFIFVRIEEIRGRNRERRPPGSTRPILSHALTSSWPHSATFCFDERPTPADNGPATMHLGY